jgi:hypothetical protein
VKAGTMAVQSPDNAALANALRALGFSERALPDAITALPTAELARRWVEILGKRAFGKKLISAIPVSGFDPDGYQRWRETGLAEREALTLPPKLAGAGLGLEDYRRWQSAGFTADELKKLLPNVTKGLNFDDALWALQHWFHGGESSAIGAVFELREILRGPRTLADLRRLIASDFSGHRVFVWFRSGIPDTAWTDWMETGLGPREAAGFARLGISPITAKQWADAELNATDIEVFIAADIPLDRAFDWAKAGVDASDVDDFIEIGISPSELATYGIDGIRPYQVTRIETDYRVELEPWQKDPVDQLPQVIEPGNINLSLWSPSPWHDEPLECAVSIDWDGKHTVEWSVVSGMGMSMNSEVSFSGIASWPDGENVEVTYTRDYSERGIDRLSSVAPTAGNPDGAKDPQRWVQLASSLVDLMEGLLESGIEADDELTNEYYDPASDEWMEFDELFRIYLTRVVPGAPTDFKDWLTDALEEGTYTIDESA